jgi:signal peptidase I
MWNIARTALLWAMVVGAVGLFAASRLYPALAGLTTVAIEGRSMGDALPFGALAYVRPSERYAIGDVVTFRQNSYLVTHRIVGDASGDPDNPWWVTRGDANGAPDAAYLRDEQIIGRVVAYVPWLGVVTRLGAQPPVVLFSVLSLALVAMWPPTKTRGSVAP